MAEGDGSPENEQNKVISVSEDSEMEESLRLDIGVDISKNLERSCTVNDFAASGSNMIDPPKKEDNPFSFKHFLRSDGTNYLSQGARPKVYCDGRPVTSMPDLDIHSTVESKNRIVPELSSALPDFVQDHLVVEQCYLNKNNSNRTYTDNLPDFAIARPMNLEVGRNIERRNHAVPLDLPVRPPTEFPLDLPVNDIQSRESRSCPPVGEVAVSKSLPDFLADGAVRTQSEDAVPDPSPERDGDRYRQELEMCRRQLAEQTRRCEYLQRQLEVARDKELEYTQNLGKALEQVEDNLEMSNKRADTAESTVLKLRQEVKALNSQINQLRRENRNLRGDEGAAGGPTHELPSRRQSQVLARQLRVAASTAENNLRQLLSGVENLRMMASSLETIDRVEDGCGIYDYEDEKAGPAL